MLAMVERGNIADPATVREFENLIARLRGFLSQSFDEDGQLIVADPNSALVPVGCIAPFAGSVAPTGYRLCDGNQVSRVTYKSLFDVIGTAYGAGDGATTFHLPDLRQRFLLGRAAEGAASTLGATGGAFDHTHTVGAHSHTLTGATDGSGGHSHSGGTSGAGGHDHTFSGTTGTAQGSGFVVDFGGGFTSNDNTHSHPFSGTTSSVGDHSHSVSTDAAGHHSHNVAGSTSSDGSGASSSSNPPYAVVNYIIYTGVK